MRRGSSFIHEPCQYISQRIRRGLHVQKRLALLLERSTCFRVPLGTVFRVEESRTDREVGIALLPNHQQDVTRSLLLFGEHARAFTTAERLSLILYFLLKFLL